MIGRWSIMSFEIMHARYYEQLLNCKCRVLTFGHYTLIRHHLSSFFIYDKRKNGNKHIRTVRVYFGESKAIFYNTMNISQAILPKDYEGKFDVKSYDEKNNLGERFDDYERLVTWAALLNDAKLKKKKIHKKEFHVILSSYCTTIALLKICDHLRTKYICIVEPESALNVACMREYFFVCHSKPPTDRTNWML